MFKKYDFVVFIGRFQPFHIGHRFVIEKGLAISENVVVLCGSTGQPRSLKNPWIVKERQEMIRASFSKSDNKRILIRSVKDVPDDDNLWVFNVHKIVESLVYANNPAYKASKISLIGHSKDQSSYYLNLFPKWDAVMVENYGNINSTYIREKLFKSEPEFPFIKNLVSASVYEYLKNFTHTKAFNHLLNKAINLFLNQ